MFYIVKKNDWKILAGVQTLDEAEIMLEKRSWFATDEEEVITSSEQHRRIWQGMYNAIAK